MHAGELRRLRRPEGLAAAQPRRHPGGPLHRRAADARAGAGTVSAVAGAWSPPSADPAAARPADLVERRFRPPAPNRVVGRRLHLRARPGRAWSTSRSSSTPTPAASSAGAPRPRMRTELVLDALEQAIWTRQREGVTDLAGLIHHHDAGSQYTSIAFTERLAEAGDRRPRSGRSATPRQRPGRVRDRAVQDRTDQTPRAVAHRRAGRDRHPGVGRLVQPPPPATRSAATSHPPSSKQPTTVTPPTSPRPDSQRTESPDTPGRFTSPTGME